MQGKGLLKQSLSAAESTMAQETQPDGVSALAAEVMWGCRQTKEETHLGFPSALHLPQLPAALARQLLPRAGDRKWDILAIPTRVSIT